MILQYPNKRTDTEIYNNIADCEFVTENKSTSANKLIECENLIALKKLITGYNLAGKIDLIYIDPPFSTNNTFTITDERASTISNSKNG